MAGQTITNLFNDIYDSTNRKVLIYITAKCKNTADISDIFQETYTELYAVLIKRGIGYIGNHEAFVMNIAKQKVYRYYSLLDRLRLTVSVFSSNQEGEEVNITDLETDSFILEDAVSENNLVAEINVFLSTKPETVKKIFYLFYCLQLSIPKIAKLLALSESNVKNKLYRTLKELRKRYTQ